MKQKPTLASELEKKKAEITANCKELQESLIEDLLADQIQDKGMRAKDKSRKRVQLARALFR